jgi:glycosyltransferase involved in cell wall biosynthesis
MDRHIVLIGINYQHRRSSGDKNFWFQLVPLLAEKLSRITVISIRRHDKSKETEKIHNCQINIHYLPPAFLETPDANYKLRIFWKGGAFPSGLGLLEKALNTSKLTTALREIHKEDPFGHVHLMDNLGFANKRMVKTARSLEARISLSAMAYQGKRSIFYHPYLRLSLNHPALCVIPYSASYKDKLIELGLDPKKIIHIPWGIIPGEKKVTARKKYFMKKELNIPTEKPLFVWAGYIQQIQKNDFLFAIRNAEAALERGLDATFYFSFKPETMEKGFEEYHKPSKGIYVESTSPGKYNSLRLAADVFYSPVTNKKCILTPPLTWIEMMALGVPIITTNAPGASAIVEEGKTGYMAANDQDILNKIVLIRNNFSEMQIECMKKVEKSYNLYAIADKYLNFWFNQTED